MPGPGIPPIKWGTFRDAHGVTHVAPAIEQYLMKGHRLSIHCACGPHVNKGPNHFIVVHEVIH
jgi:hypothetical protein